MTGSLTSTTKGAPSVVKISDFVGSRGHFARSVNLQHDIAHPEQLTTYYFGRKSIQFLEGFLDSLAAEIADRASFVVGPYGSGKSTFGLFLSCLLGGRQHDSWLRPALERLKSLAPVLHRRLEREVLDARKAFVPVVVQGHRGDLAAALLTGLLNAARGHTGVSGWLDRAAMSRITHALSVRPGKRVDSSAVAELYKEALAQAARKRKAGLFLVVDEFGKFLEGAAYQSGGVDLMPLQDLAEMATRATSPQLHLLVFLHQSLEHYATGIPQHQRQEWAKIQGRFREVDFAEDADEVYDLVAAALSERRRTDSGFHRAVSKWARDMAGAAVGFPAFQIGAREQFWADLFEKTYPLHPLTLFALPRLSARVAQNERTVFTFLASDEPLGLRGFLSATAWSPAEPPVVCLDYLYDYFLQAFRGDLSVGNVSRRWVEVASALERLGDRPEVEQRVLKAVGVLNLMSVPRLAPSTKEMLAFALNVSKSDTSRFEEALQYLVERKLLVFRRYTNEYRVWQGSDFEFDEAVDAIRSDLRKNFDLAAYLQAELPPSPIVARRHSHKFGLLRFFSGGYATVERLRELDRASWNCPEWDVAPPDGRILYVLPGSAAEIEEASRLVKKLRRRNVVVVVPRSPVPYLQAAMELVALHRLETSATELRDDPVAQRELHERVTSCQDALTSLVAQVVQPVRGAARWFVARGKEAQVRSNQDAQRLISRLCDRTYPDSPVIRNEMINRSVLSSNIATARNRLVAAILEDNGKPNLGLSGNPPELTVFRAVFTNHGIYREQVGKLWQICEPRTPDRGYRAVWKAIEQDIFQSKTGPVAVSSILERLSKPPYGVRMGIAQLLVFGVCLHHRDSIALYEDGTFIPDWSIDRIEILFKRPDHFTLRYLDLEGSRRWIVDAIRKRVPVVTKYAEGCSKGDGDRFGDTLKALYRWIRALPAYARATFTVSETAQRVRAAIMNAKIPEKLLFEDLPAIFGIRPDSLGSSDDTRRGEGVESAYQLVAQLSAALAEIDRSYDNLLERIQRSIVDRIGLSKELARARSELQALKEEICPILSDPRAKVFLTRASDERQGAKEWTESVAAGVEGKPPAFWIDAQEEDFTNGLARIAQQLRDARSLCAALARTSAKTGWERFERVLIDAVVGTSYEEVLPKGELSKTGKQALAKLRRALAEQEDLRPHERRVVVVQLLKELAEKA